MEAEPGAGCRQLPHRLAQDDGAFLGSGAGRRKRPPLPRRRRLQGRQRLRPAGLRPRRQPLGRGLPASLPPAALTFAVYEPIAKISNGLVELALTAPEKSAARA